MPSADLAIGLPKGQDSSAARAPCPPRSKARSMSFEYAPTLNADLRFFALHGYAANLGHVAEFHTAAWEIFLPIARREHRTQCRNCTQRGLVGPVCVDRTNENAIALLERFFRARQE